MARCDAHRSAIAIVLGLAAIVRFWGLGFGLPYAHSRPDEVATAGPAVACLVGNCRPPDFYYPSLFIYSLAGLYLAFYAVTRPLGWYSSVTAFADSRRETLGPFFYLGRGLSALMGTLTVWWLYVLGRTLFDRTVGLVAALFLSMSLLHVRDSHFSTTDITMTALIVLAVLITVRWEQAGTLRNAALAGLATGLAASAKYNGLGTGVSFLMAMIMRIVNAGAQWRSEAIRVGVGALLFGAGLLVAFFGTTPYILIEWDRFLHDAAVRGAGLARPHSVQLPPGWITHATVSLPAALGWPVYIASLGGTIGLLATRFRQAAVVLAFPAAYYLVSGNLDTVFARYSLPLVPFLALNAGWLVVWLVRAVTPPQAAKVRVGLISVVSLALVAPSAIEVWRLGGILSRDDTRVEAVRTLMRIVAPGSSFYQSGGQFGRVPLDLPGQEVSVRELRFDEAAGIFTADGATNPILPDWIVIQRSPLVAYSYVPVTLEQVVRQHYRMTARIDSHDDRAGRVYDQQDAFFLPLSGLAGVSRVGPNIEVYRRASSH